MKRFELMLRRTQSPITNHHLPAVLIAASLLLSACNQQQTVQPTPTPIPTAAIPRQPTYNVARGEVIKTLEFLSRIQPIEDEQLAFEVEGRIAKINFKTGNDVQAGDVIAELDVSDLRNQIEQATIEYSTAQLVLSRTLATFTETLQYAQLDLNVALLRLQQAQARDFGPAIALAQAEIARAQRSMGDAEAGLNSARNTPADKEMIPGFERIMLDAQIQLSRARSNLQDLTQAQKQHAFDISILGQEVQRQRLNLSKIKNSLDPNLERAVEVGRLTLERLQKQLGRAQIIAPFDGKLTAARLTVGGNVRALDPVVVIAKPGALEAAADIAPERLTDVTVGMTVTIALNNQPGKTFVGVVRRMPPLSVSAAGGVNQDKSMRITIQDAEGLLKDGDLARCLIITAKKDSVLWLPPQAVRNFQGRRFVVVKEPDGERRADVKLGLQSEDRLEILSGVLEGQTIVSP
jgi:RND family efflux transporter MFP subunit